MEKSKDHRYLDSEEKFLEFSFQALRSQFSDRAAFDDFYQKIDKDDDKNSFLRSSSFYLFLAKNGNWIVDVEKSNPVISYLNDGYKLVSIFSIIESLYDNSPKHQDFHDWLISKPTGVTYPLSKEDIKSEYCRYKEKHGSIKQCVKFFESLPQPEQSKLISAFCTRHDTSTPNITEVAKYLYDLRSKFVHEGAPVFLMPVFALVNKKRKQGAIISLSIQDILQSFERGLIIHFSSKHNIESHSSGCAQSKCSAPIQNESS